jgi:murein DD-endopeptidase MepM/ murein hydrolase activator NlpD
MKYPVKGRVTSKFGYRKAPTAGASTGHNGLDIGVPIGTAVICPANGTVKNVYSNNAGGNQLIIEHTNGFRTGYAHLSKTLVSIGEKVKEGQKVAETGNTGISTGPHLHLTLRKNGELVNPEDYFEA